MGRVLLIRLGQSLIVLFAVSVIVFVLMHFTGDPVLQMLPRIHTQEQYDSMRLSLGLDDPLPVQFFRFIGNASHGDLGYSYHHSLPAMGLILNRMPATVELAIAAMIFAASVAFPLGIISALRPHGAMSRVLLSGSLLGISMPTFFTGLMFIFIFGVLPSLIDVSWLPRMPTGGRIALQFEVERVTGFMLVDTLLARDTAAFFNAVKHLVMPAVTLGLYYLAVLMRLIRNEMIQERSMDYVRVARAKGLSETAVTVRHALRNALIPVVTVMGLQLGGLIAFSLVTETVFSWPGMGRLLIEAIGHSDRPIVMSYLLLVSVIFVSLNFLVDLLYTVIDPRIRVSA